MPTVQEVSAIAASVSAAVAAVSATMSWLSSNASRRSLEESRLQRQHDNGLRALAELSAVQEVLSNLENAYRAGGAEEPVLRLRRDHVERRILASGQDLPVTTALLAGEGYISPDQFERARDELRAAAQSVGRQLNG